MNNNNIHEIINSTIEGFMNEQFEIKSNKLILMQPYDNIDVVNVGGRKVYILFGNVNYYDNKEAILAIKRKSQTLSLANKSYEEFIQEFKTRFYKINDLNESDLLVSIETTAPVTEEMASVISVPFIRNGFKKNDSSFKMRDIKDLSQRLNVKDIFSLGFDYNNTKTICVLDDFITSGSSFRNAFDKIPNEIKTVGVCLFRLNS